MALLGELGRYRTVVIDPPWTPGTQNPRCPPEQKFPHYGRLGYRTMSLDEIAELPVAAVLDDDALLFCWATGKRLPDAIRLVESWGCIYHTTMVWHKNAGAKWMVTMYLNAEFCVVGYKGRLRFADTKDFFAANYWPWQGHSAKPAGFYELLRRVTYPPRLDIFARRRIAGFDGWGDEYPAGPVPAETSQGSLWCGTS